MDAYHILVIVLAVFLAIFLILAIVVTVYVLKFVRTIQQLTDKAASVVESASSIRKVISPAIAGRFVFEAVQKAMKHHDNKSNKEK